ncbi:histidine phosphatase family protein [Arthrobacter sulfonylureivorans]|uniref:histidine phosphatase family protein n=1 Tax=Arthrobacter sulfonylureivorans TaxID=2486855 RepID=UPI0039E6FDB2
MAAAGTHDFPVLWLMRHGETEWSRDHRYTGLTDLELTPAGVQQARDAAAKLAGVRFRTVLTSPLVRARRTAALAGYPEAEVVPEAHEWDYGDYEGLQSAAIRAVDPSYLIWTHGVRGGESLQQVADRADHVIAKVLDGGDDAASGGGTSRVTSAGRIPVGGASEFRTAEMRPGTSADIAAEASADTAAEVSGPRQVLLVAHGHFLRVLAARWLGMDPIEGRHFVLETAAVCRLGWDKKTPAIAGWNL